MTNPLHIISPTSIAGPTHRLWVVFDDIAPTTSELPESHTDGRHLVAEWLTDVDIDVRKVLNKLHKSSPILFSYLQPARPEDKRRMPPGPRTTGVLASLTTPNPDAPHAALLTDLSVELGQFCPPDFVIPGWRVLDVWPDSALMIERLQDQRVDREKPFAEVLKRCLADGNPAPGLTMRQHFGFTGTHASMALLEVAILGWEHPESTAAIQAAMTHLTGSGLGQIGHKLAMSGNFRAAWAAFDQLPSDIWDSSAHANALWAIQADNSGLGLQPDRARKYLEKALPYGTRNPTIFYNAACVFIELGDVPACLVSIQNAVRFSSHQLDDPIRAEALFANLVGTPEFEAAFEVESISVERERIRAAQVAQQAAIFAQAGAELPMSEAGKTLIALAKDLSGKNAELVKKVEAALANPPFTVEIIGFYPSRKNTPFENCYRFMVSQLSSAGLLMAAEDKYSYGVFKQFAAHIELPDDVKKLRQRNYDQAEFLPTMAEIEARFEAKGLRLTTLWTGGGDHLYFTALPPEIAARWANVSIGTTHDSQHLGLRSPCWGVLFDHLSYAFGWSEPLQGWREPAWI